MLKEASKQFWERVELWSLIITGSIVWSLTMVKSGLIYSFGMGFWGANGHDAIWHIALAESLGRWSLTMPVFTGSSLQNYHIGFDLLLTLLNKITAIPVVNIYFQILPPIFAFFIGYLSYIFVLDWTRSEKASLWAVFFVYFGGSFGYLIGRGESTFWSQQAISTLINPPFALSLIFILSGLIFLQRRKLVLAAIFFGILIEVKAYAGILSLGALFVSGIYQLIKQKKFDHLLVFFGSLAISLTIYLPLNKSSVGLVVWQPFWFLETMMGLTDRVGWLKFYSAMTTYKAGHVWVKEILAYSLAFAIFWVGNMGTRILKEAEIFRWIKNLKNLSWIEVFVASVIIAGGAIPMFFLQKGTPWNTIQFFYYSLFFSAILAGVAASRIRNRLVATLIVLATIPITIFTLKDVYLPSRPPAKLDGEELSALNFLRKQPDGIVLTYPFDETKAKEAEGSPPRPLYLYASTAYVSAISSHPTFLEDEINLDITGYNWRERKSEVENGYKEKDQAKARGFLKENHIKYVYWLKGQRAFFGEGQLGLIKIFENKEVDIFMVES